MHLPCSFATLAQTAKGYSFHRLTDGLNDILIIFLIQNLKLRNKDLVIITDGDQISIVTVEIGPCEIEFLLLQLELLLLLMIMIVRE